MWGVVVALLFVSTAISEDVVNTTTVTVTPIDIDVTEEPIKASRRSSSDSNVPDNTSLLRTLQISTPPAILQGPSNAEISLPDLSQYLSPPAEAAATKGGVTNVGYSVQQPPTNDFKSHVMDQSQHYITQSLLPDLNGQIVNSQIPGNALHDYSKLYSTNNHLPGLQDQMLLSQRPKYNVMQSLLNYPIGTQYPIQCQDHSDILYKIWLILSPLLESLGGSTIPHANQIKYALMLINNYLQQSNIGSPNEELMLKLMLLEAELEKERVMLNTQPNFHTWLNMIPGLNNNIPKLPIPYETLNSAPMLSKCKNAFTKLLEWAQASYESILKSPDCHSNHIALPANYGDSPVATNRYAQIPYSSYNINKNLLNPATYTFGQVQGSYSSPLLSQYNKDTIDTPSSVNTQWTSAYNPSILTQPNQNQPSIIPNIFVANTQSQIPLASQPTSYLPYSYSYQSTAVKNVPVHSQTLAQIAEPEKSYQAQILQPSSIYQKDQTQTAYIPVTRESVPTAQYLINGQQTPGSLATNINNISPLAVYNDFATNLQNAKGLTNKLSADDVHQQINFNPRASNSVMMPQKSGEVHALELIQSVKAPSEQLPLDQNAMRGILQNITSSQVYRDNIQNYLSSQNIPSSLTVPQQYGTYNYASYQSVPNVNNAFLPINQIKENLNIQPPKNLGVNQNLYQGALPAQYGSYSHYSYQTAPYINTASLPLAQNMHVPAANYLQGINQNLYKGTLSTDKASPIIDWYSIANSPKLDPNYTPNGEVELTYAVRRPVPTGNQPLYFIKYRIPYDVFMQNVRSLLSMRSGKPDLSKDLVLRSNASEIPKDLASFPKEEVTEMVVKEGDLIKARYIDTDGSDNDNVSIAADSINALLNKTINAESLNEYQPGLAARNDLTRSRYENANQNQYGAKQPVYYQRTVNTNQNSYGTSNPSGVNPLQPGSNEPGLRQAAVPSAFNSGSTREHTKTTVQKPSLPLEMPRNY